MKFLQHIVKINTNVIPGKMSYLFTEIVDSGLVEEDEEVNQPEPPPPGVDMDDLLAEGNLTSLIT